MYDDSWNYRPQVNDIVYLSYNGEIREGKITSLHFHDKLATILLDNRDIVEINLYNTDKNDSIFPSREKCEKIQKTYLF